MKNKALGRGLGALIPDEGEGLAEGQPDQIHRSLPKTDIDELEDGEVGLFPVDQIIADEDQARKKFDRESLEELAASIEKYGVLQPILLTPLEDGLFKIVAGERRFRAAKLAGLETIPAQVRKDQPRESKIVSLIENIQREDLNPYEEALAYKQLIDEYDMTQKEIGESVGKSRSQIANTLRLLQLDDESLNALKDGKITSTQARSLLTEEDLDDRRELLKSFLSGQMTVNKAEKNRKKTKSKTLWKREDPYKDHYETELREVLGTKVSLKEGDRVSKIEIEYYSKDDLERIINLIQGK